MHTVGMLEQALTLIKATGYLVRQEWLGGSGGGGCQLRGRKVFFLDLALTPAEQLDQVLETLHSDPDMADLPVPRELGELLRRGRTG